MVLFSVANAASFPLVLRLAMKKSAALDGTVSLAAPGNGPNSLLDALFGRLAIHNGFVDQEKLDQAISQQKNVPSASLADILVQKGAISEDVKRAVEHLLHVHVARHNSDPPAEPVDFASLFDPISGPGKYRRDRDLRPETGQWPAAA